MLSIEHKKINKKILTQTVTVNATSATLLGSASGSTQVHTNRQTKLRGGGWVGGGKGLEGARRSGRRAECQKRGEVSGSRGWDWVGV